MCSIRDIIFHEPKFSSIRSYLYLCVATIVLYSEYSKFYLTFTENSTGDSNHVQIQAIEKQEGNDDDVDDDQMTEAPPSPQIPPSPPSPISTQLPDDSHGDGDAIAQTDSVPTEAAPPDTLPKDAVQKKSDTTVAQQNESVQNGRDKESVPDQSSCKTNAERELEAPEFIVPIAARVRHRRATTVANHSSEPLTTPMSQSKKRRLSIVEKSNMEASPRTRSHSVTEHDPITPKRVRIDSVSGSNKAPSKADASSETKAAPEITPAKKAPSSTHDKSFSTPAAAANASPAQRGSKSSSKKMNGGKKRNTRNDALTPITQFFAHKPTLKCDKCSEILSSRNELNFHTKSHEKQKCAKCNQRIDNDNPATIRDHMISCLLLDNQIPKDLLARFLKVKVDLNRLTPTKIAQIQKRLCNESQSQIEEPTNNTEDVRHQERRTNDTEGTEQQSAVNKSTAEQAQTSNDESNDGKNDKVNC